MNTAVSPTMPTPTNRRGPAPASTRATGRTSTERTRPHDRRAVTHQRGREVAAPNAHDRVLGREQHLRLVLQVRSAPALRPLRARHEGDGRPCVLLAGQAGHGAVM